MLFQDKSDINVLDEADSRGHFATNLFITERNVELIPYILSFKN